MSFYDRNLENYALLLLANPYHWTGSSPMTGFDCSGYVCELMKMAGEIPHKSDFSSQGLLDFFEKGKAEALGAPQFGALLFFGESVTKVTHVAFALAQWTLAEYGGGDESTTTLEAAIARSAFGRMRPIDYRANRVACLRPYYRRLGGR